MIEAHVFRREADGFTDPQPGTGQQAHTGGDGLGTEGATWAKLLGRVASSRARLGREERRPGAAEGCHQAPVGYFSRWEHGPEIRAKAPRHTQAVGGPTCPPWGGRGTGPVHSQAGPDGARARVGLDVAYKVAQEGPLGPPLKPQGLPHPEVRVKMEVQSVAAHRVSPLQGRATATNASRSSLA